MLLAASIYFFSQSLDRHGLPAPIFLLTLQFTEGHDVLWPPNLSYLGPPPTFINNSSKKGEYIMGAEFVVVTVVSFSFRVYYIIKNRHSLKKQILTAIKSILVNNIKFTILYLLCLYCVTIQYTIEYNLMHHKNKQRWKGKS